MGTGASMLCKQKACFSEGKSFPQFEPQITNTKPLQISQPEDGWFVDSIVTDRTYQTIQKIKTKQSNAQTQPELLNEEPQKNKNSLKRQDNVASDIIDTCCEEKYQKLRKQDCKVLGILGQGNFSKVYLVLINKKEGNFKQKMVAIKVISKEKIQKESLQDSLIIEEKILKDSKSNFIAKFYTKFSDLANHYLVIEWAQCGDSFSLIQQGSKRKALFRQTGQDGIRFLLGCVILALEYLHNRGVLYIDLKPENVLIFADGYAKLTDFGLSLDLSEKKKANVKSGTTLYLSPEAVMGVQCGPQLDLWTLGILAYQLSNCATPFNSSTIRQKTQFIAAIQSFHLRRKWHNSFSSKKLKDFVHSLLKVSPEKRLGAQGFEDIKNHSFFKDSNFDWKGLESKIIESPLRSVIIEKVPFKQLIFGHFATDLSYSKNA